MAVLYLCYLLCFVNKVVCSIMINFRLNGILALKFICELYFNRNLHVQEPANS